MPASLEPFINVPTQRTGKEEMKDLLHTFVKTTIY